VHHRTKLTERHASEQHAAKCFLRYAHVLTVQAGYSALANARCNIKERLARYLLMARDSLDDNEMILTHEFLAVTLGVQRAGITRTLQSFEFNGLVETAYGSVTVKDREGLEKCANEALCASALGAALVLESWARVLGRFRALRLRRMVLNQH
jgi:CRP-like cAMP-binding protein